MFGSDKLCRWHRTHRKPEGEVIFLPVVIFGTAHTAASIVGNLERLLAPTLENLPARFGVFGKIANLVNLLKRGVRAQTRVPTRVEWLDADKTGLYTADK